MNEERPTIEEMQNWNKRYLISKENPKAVIDTIDGGEFWTIHGNEAYNLCIRLNEQDQQIKELKRMLQLVSEAETVRNENSVKEIVRNTLFGLDSVAGESANAYNDYTILNKFFKEYYNEHWDNDKFD